MIQSEDNSDKISLVLNQLLFEHYYSLSIDAAIKGNYTFASKYISDLIKSNGELPVLLDLLARINAQQGKLKEAEHLWKKCVKADPDNNEFIKALNKINKLQNVKVVFRFFIFKRVLIALGVMAFLFLLVVLIFVVVNKTSKIDSLQIKQTEIIAQIDSIQNIANTNAIDSSLLEISIKMEEIKGITIEKHEKELLIIFNEGLFSAGIELKPDLEPVIIQIAKVLEPYSGKIRIMILGCTDNLPVSNNIPFQDNNSLGMARANTIYKLFCKNSRFANDSILIGVNGKCDMPYINDDYINRLKNRTAIFKIFK